MRYYLSPINLIGIEFFRSIESWANSKEMNEAAICAVYFTYEVDVDNSAEQGQLFFKTADLSNRSPNVSS